MPIIRIELAVDDNCLSDDEIVVRVNLAGQSARVVEPAKDQHFLFPYMQKIIDRYAEQGKLRTAETYRSALNSVRRFLADNDVAMDTIDREWAEAYESMLRGCGKSTNTTSFYLRKLRAVYNHAVDDGLVADRQPFKQVYTGMGKTQKRAVNIDVIRRLRNYQPANKYELMTRDLFMFSFYTRGMAFVDMSYLKRENIVNGFLRYSRRKTGQLLVVKWEREMQDIVDRLRPYCYGTYLLPIVHNDKATVRNQYRGRQLRTNNHLKEISGKLHLERKLTMYVARHSWASIARSIGVPLNVISQAMGHTSEKTTQIYLKQLDKSAIDRANSNIMELLL